MNIVIVCRTLTLGMGGMERTACNVANFLACSSHNVFLLYEQLGEGQLAYTILPSVTPLPYERKWSWEYIRDHILATAPDVYIVFSASSDVIKLSSYIYDTGIPLVIHEGSNPQRIVNTNWAIPRKISLECAAHERNCILSSACIIRFTLPDYIESIPLTIRNQAVSFPNAFKVQTDVDTSQQRFGKKKLINIGGLKKNKNISLLLEALARIKNSIDFNLSVYGPSFDRIYEQEIRDKIVSLGLSDKISIHPEVREIEQKFLESSAHVITSEEEGFSSSVAEAMCSGIPSIGLYSCNGVRQLINDQNDGLLVRGTSFLELVSNLAHSIEKILTDTAFAHKLGVNAVQSAKRFDPQIVYPNWIRVVTSAQYFSQNDSLFAAQSVIDHTEATGFRDGLRALYMDLNLADKKFYTFLETREKKLTRSPASHKGNYDIAIIGAGDLGQIGGIEASYRHLFRGLCENKYQVKFLGYQPKNKDFNKTTELSWVPECIDIKFFERGQSLEHFRVIKTALAKTHPKLVIIIHSSRIAQFFASACFDLGIPFIFSMRGSSEYCLRYIWPCERSLWSTASLAIKTHVLMTSYAALFTNNAVNNVVVIPSPVADSRTLVDQQRYNGNKQFAIMYSGRFSFEKRVNLLLEAFAKVHEKYPDWTLVLFGEGPLQPNLEYKIKLLKIEERVSICREPTVDAMYKRYQEHHVIVLTSQYEGCPLAIREGMAHGLVPIAYRECSGIEDIIENKVNGLLAEGIDSSESLADSLDQVMGSEALRTQLSRTAKESIKKYDPDLINSKWVNMIRDALAEIEYFDFKNCPNLAIRQFRKYLFALKHKGGHARDILEFADQPVSELERQYYALLSESPLFDYRYYLETYYHVKEASIDPLLHYINEGWKRGYNPSANFCSSTYIANYALENLDVCPLVHFYLYGLECGYLPVSVPEERTEFSFTTVPVRKPWDKATDPVVRQLTDYKSKGVQ